MELSKRLMAVAGAVTAGNRVADVGTDHAYVPIYLVKHGICPGAIAMDINEGPLLRAEAHISENGLSARIETRLSDGLAGIEPDETDTIVIAGMGGALMCRILKDRPEFIREGKELILQPQSEWSKVRHFLAAVGYQIMDEHFLKDEGKYYLVLKCLPGPISKPEELYENPEGVATCFLYEYGPLLLKKKEPVYMEYLGKQLRKKKLIVTNIKRTLKEDSKADSGMPVRMNMPGQPDFAADSAAEENKTKIRLKELENEIKELEKVVMEA